MPSALLDAVTSLLPAHFAVIDGAHFDDLPGALAAARLPVIPLYLEASDGPGVAAGPHLVPADSSDAAQRLMDIAGDLPALVFWSWPGTTETLRRHLRGINLAEIPENDGAGYEAVLFRHWDPNVLAVTLPVLTREQQSRFLGQANGLAYDANEHGGVVLAGRPDGLPPPRTSELLRFSPEQMAGITEGRMVASFRRIAAYLREVAPEHTARMDDSTLLRQISRFEVEAQGLGLTTEQDIGRWAFLQVMTGCRLATDPLMREAFRVPDYGDTPSYCLDRLFHMADHLLRERA